MPKGKDLPVAVVGAGMIRFGELFNKGYEDMVVEAYKNCLTSVDKGIDERNIEAAWLGVAGPGFSMRREVLGSSGLAEPLRFFPRPVTGWRMPVVAAAMQSETQPSLLPLASTMWFWWLASRSREIYPPATL